MIEVKTTCDLCKLAIKLADRCTLQYSGIMGHNQVPLSGWHFHYSCFCKIVAAILAKLNESTKQV